MLEDFKVVTPLVKLASFTDNDAYIKLEGSNLFGSAKDRCAIYVLTKLLEQGTIGPDTEIVESSSGNMGVALAAVGARVGLKITIMIDESISKLNEFLITSFGARTVKITQADENGSYLKARLQTVRDYIAGRDDVYWFNQYGNPLVIEAYRETVGRELCRQLPDVEYLRPLHQGGQAPDRHRLQRPQRERGAGGVRRQDRHRRGQLSPGPAGPAGAGAAVPGRLHRLRGGRGQKIYGGPRPRRAEDRHGEP